MELETLSFEFKFAQGAKPGVFSGYGAVFGNVDAYGDVIQQGAFAGTLADWKRQGRLPPMLVQHGGWGITDEDGLPIGRWTSMVEDAKGLLVEGRLINLDTERGKQIYGAMQEGVLDGLSIGYRAKEYAIGTKPTEPKRTLKAVDLVELSVVTMPANSLARVSSVKSIASRKDYEAALRKRLGLTRAQASRVAFLSWSALASETAADTEIRAFAARIAKATDELNKGLRNPNGP